MCMEWTTGPSTSNAKTSRAISRRPGAEAAFSTMGVVSTATAKANTPFLVLRYATSQTEERSPQEGLVMKKSSFWLLFSRKTQLLPGHKHPIVLHKFPHPKFTPSKTVLTHAQGYSLYHYSHSLRSQKNASGLFAPGGFCSPKIANSTMERCPFRPQRQSKRNQPARSYLDSL
jgi:hypothetical protein